MSMVSELKKKVLAGIQIGREEAMGLQAEPLEELAAAADEIREYFCGNAFDMCTIVNGKCGRCSEDCRYCAQSVSYHTACEDSYSLLPAEELLRQAKYNDERGVLRYSIVTSGRSLPDREVDQACEAIREIRRTTGKIGRAHV